MKLTPHQTTAFDAAMTFLKERGNGRQFFNLHGWAGTGKTTLLAEIARNVPGATIVAPTGKAAAVLRNKLNMNVLTIHAALYQFLGNKRDPKTGKLEPQFMEKLGIEDAFDCPFLLDEASMVGSRLAESLLKTGMPIISSGDPGQLPPVKDRPFFDQPDAILTEIHRQALDSPIIRQATAVREGRLPQNDGGDFEIVFSPNDVDILTYDASLTWRNDTRDKINLYIRKLRGIDGPVLRKGEPLMCLLNSRHHSIWNGEIYELTKDREPGGLIYLSHVDVDGVVRRFDPDYDEAVENEDDRRIPFDLGYAMTVHKSQGSEWPRVLIVGEMGPDNKDFKRWLYTGITRAKEHVTLIQRW